MAAATSLPGALASLHEYDDDDDGDDASGDAGAADASAAAAPDPASAAPELAPNAKMFAVQSAPDVDVAFEKERRREYPIVSSAATTVFHNPRYEDLYAPEQGPQAPDRMRLTGRTVGGRNHHMGSIEQTNVHQHTFDEQFHTFGKLGVAANPSAGAASGLVGDASKLGQLRGQEPSVYAVKAPLEGARVRDDAAVAPRKRLRADDPYAPLDFPLSRDDSEQLKLSAEEQKIVDERAKERAAAKAKADENAPVEETSIFHGTALTDYQGRTYMHAPAEVRSARGEHECFIPRQLAHTYSGHTKGVAAIRLLPETGHLLLSAGMDSKVKLWDVCNARKCLRTFLGHGAAVRDICFSNDGRRFLSCSYDRFVKLWDTETGQCLGAYTTKKLPYCVKFHPDEDKQNIFLVGQADKQVVQWDQTSGEPVQFYNQHLGAVNTVTFCDGNRRFVSTADDKRVLVWEYGIPVPIKHISEPHMHSIPFVAVHPNEKWLLGQSLDNQIVVYGVHNRFRQHNKKLFKGHTNAGYACQVGMTPDGQFVLSGDADGKVYFWDWKSTKIFRKLKCHDGVCIGAAFHPVFPSQMATCGWDGTIKLWE